MHIYADGLTQVTLNNNNVRISLMQNGSADQPIEVGTLIMPASQVREFVNNLMNAMQQIEAQMAQITAKPIGSTH